MAEETPKTVQFELSTEEKLRLENIALKQANAQHYINQLQAENDETINGICKRVAQKRELLQTLNYMTGEAIFNKE